MVELVYSQKKLTVQEVKEFESIFSVVIPDSFKEHYLRINGGSPSESDAEAELWGLPVHGFNPIKYGTLTIEMLVEDIFAIKPDDPKYGIWGYKQFLPFAYDDGGNTIFLSLRKNDFGEVYIYDMDGKNIFHIDYSFSSFLKRLYKMD